MANLQTDGPVMILDTAGLVTQKEFNIKTLVWSGIVTNGDDLEIWDINNAVLFKLKGGANQPVTINFRQHMPVNGLQLKVIDSGTVCIYG